MPSNIKKLYELRTLGYDQLHKELAQISADFAAIRKAKQEAEKALASSTSTTEAAKLRAELAKIKVEEAEISKASKQLQADMKAEQLIRQAEITQIKDATALEKANAEAAKLVAKQRKESITAEAGSYAALVAEVKAFYALLKSTPKTGTLSFQGELFTYDQAILKYKELTAAEQAFRRQFAADKTLVGEYTSGIVQAFKQLGLDDLVSGQVNRAAQRLAVLKTEALTLKDALNQIRNPGGFDELNNRLNAMTASGAKLDEQFIALDSIMKQAGGDGAAALNLIETHLVANAKEAGVLRQQIGTIQTELRGTGDIGDRITTGLANGFKSISGQVAQFALSFVGVQAALFGIINSFNDIVALDSLNSALKVVSITEKELGINQQFLQQTTKQLGLEFIGSAQAFKNFYAAATQAGLSAQQTRDIFYSASSAAAALKLSQEDTNGVLLAFSQIASKGTVQAEELRGQIGERVPGAFAIAAKAIGVTQQELNKMLQGGKVLANDFLPKFAAELQKTFGGDSTKNVDGLQASINRLKNEFTDFLNRNSKTIAAFLTALIGVTTGILGLVGYLPLAISLLAAYTIGWGLLNKEVFAQRALVFAARYEIVLLNIQLILGRIALFAITAAQYLFTAALAATNLIIRIVTVAMNLFGISMGALPIKIIITLLGGLALAFSAMAASTAKASENLKGLNAQLKQARLARQAANEVEKEAIANYQKEAAQLETLYKVATNNNITLDTRRNAIQKLIDQYPEYFGNLSAETATIAQLKEGYDKLSSSILQSARVAASAKLAGQRQADAAQAAALQGIIETEFALNKSKKGDFRSNKLDIPKLNLSDADKEALRQVLNVVSPDPKGNIEIYGVVYNYKDIINGLQEETKRRQAIAEQYTTLALTYQNEEDKKKAAAAALAKTQLIGRIGNRDVTEAEVQKLIDDTKKQLDALKLNDPNRQALIDKIAEYQKIIDDANGKKTKSVAGRADKLSVDERNDLNSKEAQRNNEIAQLELHFAKIRELRDLSVQEEIDYLIKLRDINNKYDLQKIQAIKSNNASEKAERATLNKQIIDNDIATTTKIKDVYKKDFEEKSLILKKNIETDISQINAGLAAFQDDPTQSNEAKATAAKDANDLVLQLTTDYYNKLEALAIADKQKITNIEEEKQKALADIIRKGVGDQRAINAGKVQDIQDKGDSEINIQKKQFADIRKLIEQDGSLNEQQRQTQLENFDRAEKRAIAAIELNTLNQIVAFKKKLFEKGLISQKEYEQALGLQAEKAAEVASLTNSHITATLDTFNSGVNNFISGLGKLFKGVDLFNKQIGDSGISVGFVLSQSFDLAKQAMNGYFDAQAARVQQEKDLQIKRLDIEQEQVKARAQSTAEQTSLDKQYQERKDAITKDAGEKLKKQKKAEVLIALAAQEANIAVQAAANPLNAITFGGAGLTQFAILSGIAIAGAALQIAAINRQQFAAGGKVMPANIPNGRISSRPNIPTQPNGDNIYATVKVGEVILNEEQQRRLGGAKTFKAIGVPGFAAGGLTLTKYPTAPVFVPSNTYSQTNNNGVSKDDLIAIMDNVNGNIQVLHDATNSRIDRLTVEQVTSTVTSAQRKQARQVQRGSL